VTIVLALLLSAALIAIAAVHVYWGIGGHWPATDERSLARTVVGSAGIERMPSGAACFAVAAVLSAASLLPFMAVGVIDPPWPRVLTLAGLVGCGMVFVGRGVMSFVPALRRFGPEEPFATYDKRIYGPLCLMLGAAFFTLVWR
jgi:hypothetical protein